MSRVRDQHNDTLNKWKRSCKPPSSTQNRIGKNSLKEVTLKKRIFFINVILRLMSACNNKSEDLTVPKDPDGTDKTQKRQIKSIRIGLPIPAQLDFAASAAAEFR